MKNFNFIDKYNAAVGAVVSIMTAVFGTYWYIFAAYLLLNVLDWLTGWYKANKKHEESSKVGLKGALKKLGYWVIIAVAFLVANVFVHMGDDVLHMDLGFLMMVGWFTVACLMVNEVRSILENLVECGCNVPMVLIRGLAVTEKLVVNNEEGFLNDKEETK